MIKSIGLIWFAWVLPLGIFSIWLWSILKNLKKCVRGTSRTFFPWKLQLSDDVVIHSIMWVSAIVALALIYEDLGIL